MEWVFVKTVLSLLAVLGLMAGLAYLYKRSFMRFGKGPGAAVPVDLLGQRMLQPKRSILVVRVLSKVLVLGSSEEGLRTLAEFDAEELPGDDATAPRSAGGLRRRSDEGASVPRTFTEYLTENLGFVRTADAGRRRGGAKK